ncbi:hypothetical protein FNV43_RR10042 [Rhamnella rubrinervis]|uniref:ADP-ribosyl cyclase/cyclic ADP-ribose hydrolase n=1 Tax=Rhamnella rubrinervis TaxID=2594499 RepID=A0A8K0MKC9_9ROSA|nr:hypothetical protein FNV43_RR10042 [Rhamnella rubrinervis]
MASSSSNSNPPKETVYDVFMNFRGEDTRSGFTSYLYDALIQQGYKTFFDDENLPRGKAISKGLLKAIEDSRSSIVILSENYAFSSWCLTELAKIVDCMENKGQIVLPIFYHVDPSHVRNQRESYGKAFEKHESNSELNPMEVDSWKKALKGVANLGGWTLKKS